jgi:lysophospholipase L1-like esterase
MAIPPIFKTDVIGGIGNSIMYGFGLTHGWMFSFSKGIKNAYGVGQGQPARPTGIISAVPRILGGIAPQTGRRATGYAAQTYPSFSMDASPGRKCGDISGSMATVLAPFVALRTTVYIVELGTNDIGVTPAATFVPQVNAIRDAIVAAQYFRMLIWASPWVGGEDWPDGANAADLTTDGFKDKETQIAAAMVSTPNCYHVSWRQLRLATLNATTNPTHATSGIYTTDGTHPTTTPTPGLVSGETLLTNYTIGQLSFQ